METTQIPNIYEASQNIVETVTQPEIELKTSTHRALEASLFIDKKFLDVAVITGNKTPPEKLFGQKAWEGWLKARSRTKNYGNKDLSLDFILQVHKDIAAPVRPEIAGKIRNLPVRGGDYNDPSKPVSYTDLEIVAIKENPNLMFEEINDPNTGYIHYPFSADGKNPEIYLTQLIQETCDWYNEERAKPDADYYGLAAILQRKLISIHPFNDANGTMTRVIMNWVLESNGLSPSALDNPSNDILTNEKNWIDIIKAGSQKYRESKERVEALENSGIENIAYALGLSPEKAFYDYIFRYINNAPEFFSKDGMQDHDAFEEFFMQFLDELKKFKTFLEAEISVGDKKINQGGLIGDAFIEFIGSNSIMPEQTSHLFLSDLRIFRGGSLDVEEVDDILLCQIMSNYTGIGTGYRALSRSYMSALSGEIASRQQVAESADYYNKSVAKYFFSKHKPDSNPYGDDVKDLNSAIRDHVAANKAMWESPFASTSFSSSISLSFAGGLARYGFFITAKAPREGMVLSFVTPNSDTKLSLNALGIGYEKEGLVVGGLNPSSIESIRIYDGKSKSASFIVEWQSNGIVIKDLSGQYVMERVYVYDDGNKRFVLKSDTTLDTLSASISRLIPQEEAVTGPTYPAFDFGMLDHSEKPIKKYYETEIKSEFNNFNFIKLNEFKNEDKLNDKKKNKINNFNEYKYDKYSDNKYIKIFEVEYKDYLDW